VNLTTLGIWSAAGVSGVPVANYRLQTLGGTGTDDIFGLKINSSNSLYGVGRTTSTGAGGSDALIFKLNDSGTSVWQRVLGTSAFDRGNAVAIDSSENVYAAGLTNGQGLGVQSGLVAKYDSSGAIQWQRILSNSDVANFNGVSLDSAGNVYLVGSTQASPPTSCLIVKYNSSGTLQWQRTLSSTSTDVFHAIAVDSSGDVYVVGTSGSSSGPGSESAIIVKYNSSGTLQWQRFFGGLLNEQGLAISLDSSSNVYITGDTQSTGAGFRDLIIVKYNSSGTLQWQRILGGAFNDIGRSVILDSSNNIYVAGQTDPTGADVDFLIVKYDSSGTIQWQRSLGGTSFDVARSLFINSSGDLFIGGFSDSAGAGGQDGFIAVLPSDGSLTGTYVLNSANITYAASTLTAATSSLTSSTANLTDSSSSLTGATSTLTDSTASLTIHTVSI